VKVTDLAGSKTIGGAVVHWFASRLSRMQGARKDERSFTLIELLVVGRGYAGLQIWISENASFLSRRVNKGRTKG
jgi:hypothetical protein